MEILKVLLRRGFNTPLGRFKPLGSGVPVDIPEPVRARYGLPSDAVVVGDDYRTPEEVAKDIPPLVDQDKLEAVLEAKALEMANEMAEKKFNEMMAAKASEVSRAAVAELDKEASVEGDDLLDNNIEFIKGKLKGLSRAQLEDLLERENGGKTRAGLVHSLKVALEDLEGG